MISSRSGIMLEWKRDNVAPWAFPTLTESEPMQSDALVLLMPFYHRLPEFV